MIVIGVDPGKSGAIAFLFDGADPEVKPMPVIPGGKGSRVEYDLPAIRDSLFIFKNTGTIAYIEKAQPLPKSFGGGIANFERGRCTGWAWMLTALGIPFQLVPPRTWQKVMLAGTPGKDTKQRSILAAQRLFPNVSLLRTERSKKPDHGLSDALLIAAYGRRITQ